MEANKIDYGKAPKIGTSKDYDIKPKNKYNHVSSPWNQFNIRNTMNKKPSKKQLEENKNLPF